MAFPTAGVFRGLDDRTPGDILSYYMRSMNQFSGLGVTTSFIEIYRMIPAIESAWSKRSSSSSTSAAGFLVAERGDGELDAAAEADDFDGFEDPVAARGSRSCILGTWSLVLPGAVGQILCNLPGHVCHRDTGALRQAQQVLVVPRSFRLLSRPAVQLLLSRQSFRRYTLWCMGRPRSGGTTGAVSLSSLAGREGPRTPILLGRSLACGACTGA